MDDILLGNSTGKGRIRVFSTRRYEYRNGGWLRHMVIIQRVIIQRVPLRTFLRILTDPPLLFTRPRYTTDRGDSGDPGSYTSS